MEITKTFFMHESHPERKIMEETKNIPFEKIIFLRNFIVYAGISSLSKKNKVKVPIQTILRDEIGERNLDFTRLLPRIRIKPKYDKTFFMKTLPKPIEKSLPELRNRKPKFEKKLPGLKDKIKELGDIPEPSKEVIAKEGVDSRIFKKDNRLHFKPLTDFKLKKYGKIDVLVADKEVSEIICMNNEVMVNYKGNKDLLTGIEFKNEKNKQKCARGGKTCMK